ncbi:MAG: hypothetical protein AAGJ70_08225, partial [Pseudomonadota bacterium]
ISLYRRRLRRQIGALKSGSEPPQPHRIAAQSVRTYGQDTILHFPPRHTGDAGKGDRADVAAIGLAVLDIAFTHEAEPNAARDAGIIADLKALERDGYDASALDQATDAAP